MREKVRKYFAFIALIVIGGIFLDKLLPELSSYNLTSYDYYSTKTLSEVGSKNMVTGIYLDYRLFDSLLEAGILFVVTAGILFMGKKDEEVR